MSQIDNLKKNIDNLKNAIVDLNKSDSDFDITDYLLTPRQIAKKIITLSTTSVDEKGIHIIVYGKYLEGKNGKVIDNENKFPECVDEERAINIKDEIVKKGENMVKEVKSSISLIKGQIDRLKKETKLAAKQITTAVTVLPASVTALPPGSGTPAAMSALQNVVSAVQKISPSTLDILPTLDPLINIPMVVVEDSVDLVLGAVNSMLISLISVLELVDEVATTVKPIETLIG